MHGTFIITETVGNEPLFDKVAKFLDTSPIATHSCAIKCTEWVDDVQSQQKPNFYLRFNEDSKLGKCYKRKCKVNHSDDVEISLADFLECLEKEFKSHLTFRLKASNEEQQRLSKLLDELIEFSAESLVTIRPNTPNRLLRPEFQDVEKAKQAFIEYIANNIQNKRSLDDLSAWRVANFLSDNELIEEYRCWDNSLLHDVNKLLSWAFVQNEESKYYSVGGYWVCENNHIEKRDDVFSYREDEEDITFFLETPFVKLFYYWYAKSSKFETNDTTAYNLPFHITAHQEKMQKLNEWLKPLGEEDFKGKYYFSIPLMNVAHFAFKAKVLLDLIKGIATHLDNAKDNVAKLTQRKSDLPRLIAEMEELKAN